MKKTEWKLSEILGEKKKKRLRGRLILFLMCVTVFLTVYFLAMPAMTIGKDAAAKCGMEVHRHTDTCRNENGDLICGREEHEHDMSCFAPRLPVSPYLCGKEYEHTHTEDCYSEGKLICSLTEHEHTVSCLSEYEKQRITLTGGAKDVLDRLKSAETDEMSEIYGSFAGLYVPLDESFYLRRALNEEEYESLRSVIAFYRSEAEEIMQTAYLSASDPVRSGSMGNTVDFSAEYDTPENGKNDWQIVSGREGWEGMKQTIYDPVTGTPEMRIKKTVLPAGKENEFFICLTAEPVFTHDWKEIFFSTPMLVTNNMKSWVRNASFSTSDDIRDTAASLHLNGHYSYFIPANGYTKTLTSKESTQPKDTRYVRTIELQISDTETIVIEDADMVLACSAGANYTIVFSIGDRCYKTSSGFHYDTATEKMTIPPELFREIISFNSGLFDHMKEYSSVRLAEAGGITDEMGEMIGFLGVESVSGGTVRFEENMLNWDLKNVLPDTSHSYEQVHPQGSVNPFDDFYAAVDGYQLIYRVRLKTEDENFISCAFPGLKKESGQKENPAGSVYDTNGLTRLTYQNSHGTEAAADYVSPGVRGLLYGIERVKINEDGAPLSGAEFILEDTVHDRVGERIVTGTDGKIVITGLTAGEYFLREIRFPEGYSASGEERTKRLDLSYTENGERLEIREDMMFDTGKDGSGTIVNRKMTQYRLRLCKTNEDGDPLPGAVFSLKEGTADLLRSFETAGENGEYTTDPILCEETVYTLKELSAPDGFNILPDELRFSVNYDRESGVFAVETETKADASDYTVMFEDDTLTVRVINHSGSVLPSTGGITDTPFFILGGFLTAIPLTLLCITEFFRIPCAHNKKMNRRIL